MSNLLRESTDFKPKRFEPLHELAIVETCARLQLKTIKSLNDHVPSDHHMALCHFEKELSTLENEFSASSSVKVILALDALMRCFTAQISVCGYPGIGADILIAWNSFLKSQTAFYEVVFSKDIELEE